MSTTDLCALAAKAKDGVSLNDGEIAFLLDVARTRPADLLPHAREIRLHHLGTKVGLCAIINAKSGRCGEDCAFCRQSAHYGTDSPEYPLVDRETVLKAAQTMRRGGAGRFAVVTSGKAPNAQELERIADMLADIKAAGLAADASLGLLDAEALARLQRAGMSGYHHNLETSRSFFPSICTTHAYDEDTDCVRRAVSAGLHVCSGGIFGLGESWEDRVEMALELKSLGVHSIPVNFLMPFEGTPLERQARLLPDEALAVIAVYRFLLPDKHIRICGGRESTLGHDRKKEVHMAGASGLMIGDYLTSKGSDMGDDRREIEDLGLEPEKS